MVESVSNLIGVSGAAFGYGDRVVVRVERLSLTAGRCLGIFGPNGAGKTTLVRGIAGLLQPLSGTVRKSSRCLRFGYLPQHRAMELQWPMTGFDAAGLACSARRPFGWIGMDAPAIHASMERLGVGTLARRRFAKLSGGQQQRLLLAGALAAKPDVLILDEPTDGLDIQSRASLIELLRNGTRDGLCTVIISHEIEDLLQLADEIAWLHAGPAEGAPSTIQLVSPEILAERMLKTRRSL